MDTGIFEVFLPEIFDTRGTVLVTAFSFDGDRCNASSWSGDGRDLRVRVVCFDATGAATNTKFYLSYTHNSVPGFDGARHVGAYLWADRDTAASYTPSTHYQYNAQPGAINETLNQITRQGVGRYLVLLPGMPGRTNNSTVQVAAYGWTSSTCHVIGWYQSGEDSGVHVVCNDAMGSPVDERFTLTYISDDTLSP